MVFLDAGANADCRPEHLLEFGVLGSAYARTVLGIPEPRVGLLNIGEEESKGSELARAAHALLQDSGLNFVGNVEGRDLLRNLADVVVTDGFTGNVALKLLEGCAFVVLHAHQERRSAAGPGPRSAGCCCARRCAACARRSTRRRYGGTYLLGVRGLVVICHGNSTRRAIANALRFGADALRKGVLPAVRGELERVGDAGSTAGDLADGSAAS